MSARSINRTHWKKLRLSVLLACLLGVLLMGWQEMARRQMEWEAPHRVAVIVLEREGAHIDRELVERFRQRTDVVEYALAREMSHYRGMGYKPFEFEVFGPLTEAKSPPNAPKEDIVSLLRFNWALSRYAEVHDTPLEVQSGRFDVRVYVRASTPDRATGRVVEGIGQQLGSIGVVTADFAPSSIDFAWFVTVHELLHTRGATDKYGPDGCAMIPVGLAEPHRRPLFPQPGTELMARGRPVARGVEQPPGPPGTWAVGRWTAAEIEWLPQNDAARASL